MKDKYMTITAGITFVLFVFVIFLMYLIYCYSYYDNRQGDIYLENYNKDSWDFVYDHWYQNDELTKEKFYNSINLMYDQNILRNIYDTYYKNNTMLSFDNFSNQYFYGSGVIDKNNIIFKTEKKTTLVSRKKFYYHTINLRNKGGYTTRLGIFHNLEINVPENGSISFDNEECELVDNKCNISVVFGGLHKVLYSHNGVKYFALLNVYSDDMIIDVTNIDGLVRYIGDNEVKGVTAVNQETKFVNKGSYRVSACYMPFSCPNTTHSYLVLNEDGTCLLFIYITLDVSRDTYTGTYFVDGGFLNMKFNHHTYNVFDYDTKEATDIENNTDMRMTFKIEDARNISNEKYKFTFAG